MANNEGNQTDQANKKYFDRFKDSAKRDLSSPRFFVEILALIGLAIYVYFTIQISCATQGTFKEVRDQDAVNLKVTRIIYGSVVNLTPQWTAFYYEGNQISAKIAIHQEAGKVAANPIQFAAKIENRLGDPTIKEYEFSESEFGGTTPSFLPAFIPGKTLWEPGFESKKDTESVAFSDFIYMKTGFSHGPNDSSLQAMRFYVWGKIRYKDLSPEWVQVPFCRYISADKLFAPDKEGKQQGVAVNSGNSCEPKAYNP